MNDEVEGREGPVYLIVEDVLEMYAAIIGGNAAQSADHLRNRDALEGALARPGTYAHHEQADLALQAAVLAHGIAETQPFLDGNKRTALVAMLTFLEINGYRLDATDRELADWIIGLSAGTKPEGLAELKPGTPELVELVSAGGFEGVLIWVAGLRDRVDFRVSALERPARLVVDFRNH